MITNIDFDHFLIHGCIEGVSSGTPMEVVLSKYGNDYWHVKETEGNGLIYGIIKIGFIEFHIYNETINGISYRPGIRFSEKDFKGVDIPWIYENRSIDQVEVELDSRNISYKKYRVKGPLKTFKTAGADLVGLEDGEHIFIDTEGGVTFIFEENYKTGKLEAYQICKYYNIQEQ